MKKITSIILVVITLYVGARLVGNAANWMHDVKQSQIEAIRGIE